MNNFSGRTSQHTTTIHNKHLESVFWFKCGCIGECGCIGGGSPLFK